MRELKLSIVIVGALLIEAFTHVSAASYAVTLDRAAPSTGDLDCGQQDDDGNPRSFCIACSPSGGVRAVAAACDATPGCVAFDMQRGAGRCAYLKRSVDGLEEKEGYTHYCKLDGSGRCLTGQFLWRPDTSIPTVAGSDLSCTSALDIPLNPVCAYCDNQTLADTGGLCSICGIDKMLASCAAEPGCAAVEYAQRDSCGRVKLTAVPQVAAPGVIVYFKIAAAQDASAAQPTEGG